MWIQDRFDDGRRLAERTLDDSRRLAERTLADGRQVAERGYREGRKVADAAYGDGRKLATHTYDDGRKVAGQTYDDGRHAYLEARREAERRLEEGRRFLAPRLENGRRSLDQGRKAIRDRFGERAPAVEAGVVAGAVIWPALMIAAGAGVAYFCWSQFVRGRSQRALSSAEAHGGEGPTIPAPEMVLAHNAPPRPQGHEPVDHFDAELAEPAEALMMHAPVDEIAPGTTIPKAMKAAPRAAVLKRRPAKTEAGAPAKAVAAAAQAAQVSRPTALDESLAVQGAAARSKRESPNGATSATPKRKGPTIM